MAAWGCVFIAVESATYYCCLQSLITSHIVTFSLAMAQQRNPLKQNYYTVLCNEIKREATRNADASADLG